MITLPKIKENFKKNFSLSKLTWFQTGGKAEFFYIPSHIEDLKDFLKKVNKYGFRNFELAPNLISKEYLPDMSS